MRKLLLENVAQVGLDPKEYKLHGSEQGVPRQLLMQECLTDSFKCHGH